MIGALLMGFAVGALARLLVPDMFSGMRGPSSWLLSLCLGLGGALLGYLIFTVWIGIGDTDILDWGGFVGALLGALILLPFFGIFARARAHRRR
jgi:uncharacterized membrane protein YeaQ/YmgE (transglycosylase-associated protein family)